MVWWGDASNCNGSGVDIGGLDMPSKYAQGRLKIMLTLEQTAMRLRDAEINRLRLENAQLLDNVQRLKTAIVKLIELAAKDMNYSNKIQMMELAKTVEKDY